MKVLILTPTLRGSRHGNRVTALRWARLLRQLGHHVIVSAAYLQQPCDVVIALHAYKIHESIVGASNQRPDLPIVVVMAGTDLYQQLEDRKTRRSLELAARIVVLQPNGVAALPPELRWKTRVIHQSASPPPAPPAPATDAFEVAVVGHLREVKDPMRTAIASRRLPASSRVRVLQVGGLIEPRWLGNVRVEEIDNPRYRWLGEISRRQTLEVIASSRALVLSSRSEGGANVISEAAVCGVPVIASRHDGALGLLGEHHPGLFPVGDDAALAELLERAETDPAWLEQLAARSRALAPRFDPVRERREWRRLLLELLPPAPGAYTVEQVSEVDEKVALAHDVVAGLDASPRHLDCRYFYDDEGSLLFEAICELPEYFPPRAERRLLRAHAAEMIAQVPPGAALVELGSGNAAKTRLLIAALLARAPSLVYVPIDVSRAALDECAGALCAGEPRLRVHALQGEYEQALARLPVSGPKLLLFLGSNISNFIRPEAVAFLRRMTARLGPDDRLLMGMDLKKPARVLELAYDDPRGVTERFDKNLLVRINRELGGDFDSAAWDHTAEWRDPPGRVESFLVSRGEQTVRIAALGREWRFAAGERVHVENSAKYDLAEVDLIADGAGLDVVGRWHDPTLAFIDVLLAPRRAA